MKMRLIYIVEYLKEHSDINHPISSTQINAYLQSIYGNKVNRNTLADDMSTLIKAGVPIVQIRSSVNVYYYENTVFDDAELKLLIDAVSASKIIPPHRTKALTEKILSLTSGFVRSQITGQLYVAPRVKSANEKLFYIIDAINKAIDEDSMISFQYEDYDIHKKRILRNDGAPYYVSPYGLYWDGDAYYLVGFYEGHSNVSCFRIDRIVSQPKIEDISRDPAPEGFSMEQFSKTVFHMFDSHTLEDVTLTCEAWTMRYVIDTFGEDVETAVLDPDHFTVHATVSPSPNFYRWVFGFRGAVIISAPSNVQQEYRSFCRAGISSTTNKKK